MKEVGFLVNLYQPWTVEESDFRQFVEDCVIPLIGAIKKNKKCSLSINLPLSTLELLDRYSYQDIILDFKDLYNSERLELVGSICYEPFIGDLPSNILENQIILNEYGLGYYLGSTKGFEGEASIMIRDLRAFLVYDYNVSQELIATIKDFGYTHLIILNKTENGIQVVSLVNNVGPPSVYEYVDLSVREPGRLEKSFGKTVEDGRTITKITNLVGEEADIKTKKKYEIKCKAGKKFKRIADILLKAYMKKDTEISADGIETLGIWKERELEKIEDTEFHNRLRTYVSISRFLCIEKFKLDEGASGKILAKRYIDLAHEFIKYFGNSKVTSEAVPLLEELKNDFS